MHRCLKLVKYVHHRDKHRLTKTKKILLFECGVISFKRSPGSRSTEVDYLQNNNNNENFTRIVCSSYVFFKCFVWFNGYPSRERRSMHIRTNGQFGVRTLCSKEVVAVAAFAKSHWPFVVMVIVVTLYTRYCLPHSHRILAFCRLSRLFVRPVVSWSLSLLSSFFRKNGKFARILHFLSDFISTIPWFGLPSCRPPCGLRAADIDRSNSGGCWSIILCLFLDERYFEFW